MEDKKQQQKKTRLESKIGRKYTLKQRLSSGARQLWDACDKKNTSNKVTIQIAQDAFQNVQDTKRTCREIMALSSLSAHPCVLATQSIIGSGSCNDIAFIFEHTDTDLHSVIRASILEKIHIDYISYQLLSLLDFLQSQNLAHRNIKPDTIWLNQDVTIHVAEWDSCRSLDPIAKEELQGPVLTDYVSTQWYRAPEILLGSTEYTTAVDMWAFGCILAEMALEKPLFPGSSTMNMLERIVAVVGAPTENDIIAMKSPYCVSMLEGLPSKITPRELKKGDDKLASLLLDLLMKTLAFNPNKRISAKEAMNHAYFDYLREYLGESTAEIGELRSKKVHISASIRKELAKYQASKSVVEAERRQQKAAILEELSHPSAGGKDFLMAFEEQEKKMMELSRGKQIQRILEATAKDKPVALRLNNTLAMTLPLEICEFDFLKELYLDENKLSILPPEISKLSSLTRLSLRGNVLSELPDSICELTRLQHLFLSCNGIKQLPAQFSKLGHSLTTLKYDNNELTRLEDTIFTLTSLARLSVQDNHITEIPNSISRLDKLTRLNLSFNSGLQLVDEMSHLSKLRLLKACGLGITEFPQSLCSLPSLTSLNIAKNRLSSLPPCFSKLSGLENLILSHNNLHGIPLFILPQLRSITMYNAQVAEIPKTLPEYYPALATLGLDNNKIKDIPLEILGTLSELWLQENELDGLPPGLTPTAFPRLDKLMCLSNPGILHRYPTALTPSSTLVVAVSTERVPPLKQLCRLAVLKTNLQGKGKEGDKPLPTEMTEYLAAAPACAGCGTLSCDNQYWQVWLCAQFPHTTPFAWKRYACSVLCADAIAAQYVNK